MKAQEQEAEVVEALNSQPTTWNTTKETSLCVLDVEEHSISVAAFTVMTKFVPATTNWIILPEFTEANRSHISSCRY